MIILEFLLVLLIVIGVVGFVAEIVYDLRGPI